MKKLVLFLILLFIAVFTSACVNTYAVKQLNDIAIEYLDAGDMKSAISRLEASIDLDPSIYESRYNLAVAYYRIGECGKALENIKEAQKLKKEDEPAVYYTIGLVDNCLANQIYEKINEKGEKEKIKYNSPEEESKMAKLYVEYLTEANENFDKYTQIQPNATDTKNVIETIEANKEDIAKKQQLIGE